MLEKNDRYNGEEKHINITLYNKLLVLKNTLYLFEKEIRRRRIQEEDSNKFLELCPKTLFPPSLKKYLGKLDGNSLRLIKPFHFST